MCFISLQFGGNGIEKKKKKKKKRRPTFPSLRRLRMKLHSKGISFNLVCWIYWDLDTCQIIVMCSCLNEISIISSIADYHEITLPLLVIYLFIILKKEKKIKWGNHYQWIDFHLAIVGKLDPSTTPKKKQRKIGI